MTIDEIMAYVEAYKSLESVAAAEMLQELIELEQHFGEEHMKDLHDKLLFLIELQCATRRTLMALRTDKGEG